MGRFNIGLDGLDELRGRLEGLANAEDITKVALEKSADHLVSAAKNSVVVRSGDLKGDIVRGEVEDGKIKVGVKADGVDWYAHIVEFGSVKKSARPFLRPTFEQEKATIEQIIADELRSGLGL
jgi:HK97 gp10 family phage protein